MEKPVIETWAKEEYREGVSAGAAARQLCRNLASHGGYPTLQRMLEDMLASTNQQSHEFMTMRDVLRKAIREGAELRDYAANPTGKDFVTRNATRRIEEPSDAARAPEELQAYIP